FLRHYAKPRQDFLIVIAIELPADHAARHIPADRFHNLRPDQPVPKLQRLPMHIDQIHDRQEGLDFRRHQIGSRRRRSIPSFSPPIVEKISQPWVQKPMPLVYHFLPPGNYQHPGESLAVAWLRKDYWSKMKMAGTGPAIHGISISEMIRKSTPSPARHAGAPEFRQAFPPVHPHQLRPDKWHRHRPLHGQG